MAHLSPARRRFNSLVSRPDPLVPLAETALTLAWEDQGGPSPQAGLALLDSFTAEARLRLAHLFDPLERVAALSAYLFDEQGFYGDLHCYSQHDPADSYLDRVLERRTGLPIMLALIYLELGWRLGLPVHGVGLPGHFIVRVAHPRGDQFLDPFAGGAGWSQSDCHNQIAQFYGTANPELVRLIMAPPTRSAIIARILRNLKQTYLARNDDAHALAAVERLLLLDHTPSELRDRGMLRLRVGQTYAALADLERYVRENPAADDLTHIEQIARALLDRLAPQN